MTRKPVYIPADFDPYADPIPPAPRARWLSPLGTAIAVGAWVIILGALGAWWLA